MRGKRTVGLMEGRTAGGRGGLAAKRAVTCWVCNWWAEKSTAFCLLPVSPYLQPSAVDVGYHSVLRGFKGFFFSSVSQIALTYSIIHTLKCVSADLKCHLHLIVSVFLSFRKFSAVLWALTAGLAWFGTATYLFCSVNVAEVLMHIDTGPLLLLRPFTTSILSPFQAGTHTIIRGVYTKIMMSKCTVCF